MKRALFLALISFCAQLIFSAENVWIGGSSGEWNKAENWSLGKVPNAKDDVAVINATSDTTITLTQNITLGGIKVTGNFVVLIDGDKTITLSSVSGEVFSDIGDGATLKMDNMLYGESGAGMKFVKRGKGLHQQGLGISGNTNTMYLYNYSSFDVAEGVFNLNFTQHSNGLSCNDIIIRKGAKLVKTTSNGIADDARIHIEEGGILDGASTTDVIGGVVGSGIVTNINPLFISCSVNNGPYRFDGRLHGTIRINPSNNSDLGEISQRRFIVGSRETLKNCTVEFYKEEYEKVKDFLQFASDAGGVFEVKSIAVNSTNPTSWDLKLEDTLSNPIEIIVDGRNGIFNTGVISGSGSITHTSKEVWIITNEMIKAKGTLRLLPNAAVTIGNHNAEHDGIVTNFSKIVLGENSILKQANVGPTRYPGSITGPGKIYFEALPGNVGHMIFDDFSLTNGSLTLLNGALSDITFNGGVATNIDLYMRYDTNRVITINGGDIHITNYITGEYGINWYQTGGILRSTLPISGWGQLGHGGSSNIFYYISGGELYSTSSSYARGMGLEASGDAKVFLIDGGKGYHRIGSDSQSHTLRIKDNAIVSADGLYLASDAPSAVAPYTAVIDLQGGELQLTKDLLLYGSINAEKYPTFTGTLLMNGGMLHSLDTQRIGWKAWQFGNMVTGVVQSGGAHLKTSYICVSDTLSLKVPFVKDKSLNGPDGGLSKYGRGTIELLPDNSYTGPTYIGCGSALAIAEGNSACAPLGPGSITLDNGILKANDTSAVMSYATGEGAKVSFDGVSFIGFTGKGNAVLGNSEAALDSVLERKNKGVLLVGAETSAKLRIGSDVKVKVSGGVSCDSNTKLVNIPVFECIRPSSSGDLFDFHPLTYSESDGFKPLEVTEGFGGGENSFAGINSSTAYTLESDTQVAGLEMHYKTADNKRTDKGLTIPAGITLKLGKGTGYAPLIFNNHSIASSHSNQSIEGGGTIDFGKAEGIVLISCGMYYDNWFKAVAVNCSLTGENGITFAGGLNYYLRNDISLNKANAFSGGMTIQNCTVIPMVDNSLGTGTVTVQGNEDFGGGIYVKSDSKMKEISNPLKLSGCGSFSYGAKSAYITEPEYGALRADRSIDVKGDVEIVGNTIVSAWQTSTKLSFLSGISGEGDLTLLGNGTIAFAARNTYTGKTIVESVLEVGDEGTFGSGDIVLKKGAILKFTNKSSKTVANNILGEGKIVFAGSGKVNFTGKVKPECSFVSSGEISGDVDFVKTGDNVIYLTSTNTYTGDTQINGGTVIFGTPALPSETPFAEDISVRLDASKRDSLELDENGNVLKWHDADSRNIAYAPTSESKPVLRNGIVNGNMNSVFFSGKQCRMASGAVVSIKNVFAVYRVPPSSEGSNPNGQWTCMGLFGRDGIDSGIRFEGGDTVWGSTHWLQNAQVWNNGEEVRKISRGKTFVASFMMSSSLDAYTAVGHYWGNASYNRGFWGDVAEIIVYNRQFDEDERKFVEAYLAKKWGVDIGLGEQDKLVDLLPPQSDVSVAEGATLELNGADQSFTSLSGAGDIVNNSETVSVVTLSSGALDGFAGTIGGNITLKIIGDVTIPEGVSIAPLVNLILANGVVIDLDGRNVMVNNASGSGIIRNGELIVLGENNLSDPGTMIIIR